ESAPSSAPRVDTRRTASEPITWTSVETAPWPAPLAQVRAASCGSAPRPAALDISPEWRAAEAGCSSGWRRARVRATTPFAEKSVQPTVRGTLRQAGITPHDEPSAVNEPTAHSQVALHAATRGAHDESPASDHAARSSAVLRTA